MKIKYSNYTYDDGKDDGINIDVNNPSDKAQYGDLIKKHFYDENKYNKMLKGGTHLDAYNYRVKYIDNDKELRRQESNQLRNFKLEAEKHDGILNRARASSPNEYQALRFKELFENGQIDSDEFKENAWGKNYLEAKYKIGNADGKVASRLRYTFKPEKRALLGLTDLGFFDALLPDNVVTIDNLYKKSGRTKEELEQAGYTISKDSDGNDYIEFDKTANYADDIFVGLANMYDTGFLGFGQHSSNYAMSSWDADGNEIYNNATMHPEGTMIHGWKGGSALKADAMLGMSNGDFGFNKANGSPTDIFTRHETHAALTYLSALKEKTDNITEKYYNNVINSPIEYTSWDSNPIIREDLRESIYRQVSIPGTLANFEIYSNPNHNKKHGSDTHLEKMNEQDAADVYNLLTSQNNDNITWYIKDVNGIPGLAARIHFPEEEKKNIVLSKVFGDLYKHNEVEVWFKNYLPYEYNYLVGDDLQYSSTLELQNLSRYGYNYTTKNDEELSYNPVNGLYQLKRDNTIINLDVNRARDVIYADNYINETSSILKEQFTNVDGGLTDINQYETACKNLALAFVTETKPDIVQYLINNKIEDNPMDTLLKMIGPNGDVTPKYREKLNSDRYYDLLFMYDMYLKLLNVKLK